MRTRLPGETRVLRQARQALDAWQRDYNAIRPHSALKGMTPTDCTKHTPRQLQSEGVALPVAPTANNGHQSTSGSSSERRILRAHVRTHPFQLIQSLRP
ncbi:integrase core domain-containing protein [Microvirga yunnanensis]|uniref:integrase core domain-containing protein n=1 Tax=Microvirga yunnanensis TaxID=2953740 RepID=UPI0035A0D3C3